MNIYQLNESSIYETSYSNADLVEKLGEVDIFDIKTKGFKKMNPIEIIKVCSDALYKMQRDYPYLYQFLVKCKIMYIPTYPSNITNTMAVDENNNLWINLTFVYNDCKMNSDRAFGILFHELFHIFFEHSLRFNNKYPKEMFKGLDDTYEKANTKANLCMDYEVNASMVDDNIVSQDFFKIMNGLYKKEYTGMTWEEIMDKFGDAEYKDWLEKNGKSLNDVEMKVLDAIEKASKILLDPEADEEEKRSARKQLQKTLDELLGKRDKGEKSLQDMFEDLQNSKLGDISDIAMELDDVYDDLYKDPAGMSGEELDKTLNDINRLMDNIADNSEDVGKQFGKKSEDVQSDAENARQALKDAMKKINEGGLSKEEKQDLVEKAKDALEDIISDDVEKEKLKKKREERDAKKEAERKEKLKKNHPLRKIIIVMKNLGDLINFGLISKQTNKLTEKIIDELEKLTEKKFSDMKKSDVKDLSKYLDELKESFIPDLVELINNETILNKTEDDMKRLVDGVFEHVFNAFRRMFDETIDESAKGSLIKTAAQKLRIIGKILKTQKVWKTSEDFKDGYKEEMKRLMELRKEGGDEALFKELWDNGAIQPWYLDENGKKLLDKINSGSTVSKEDDEIKPYDGIIYYKIYFSESTGESGTTVIDLSNEQDIVNDDWDVYSSLAKKFENDFPKYILEEEMEAVYSVYIKSEYNESNYISPKVDDLIKEVKENHDYKEGEWKIE